jgi:hypothetical protein
LRGFQRSLFAEMFVKLDCAAVGSDSESGALAIARHSAAWCVCCTVPKCALYSLLCPEMAWCYVMPRVLPAGGGCANSGRMRAGTSAACEEVTAPSMQAPVYQNFGGGCAPAPPTPCCACRCLLLCIQVAFGRDLVAACAPCALTRTAEGLVPPKLLTAHDACYLLLNYDYCLGCLQWVEPAVHACISEAAFASRKSEAGRGVFASFSCLHTPLQYRSHS